MSLHASLTLRPTRIAFLVRPRDLTSLRRIMRLCTCLWGGAYNPIIPVCRSLPREWKSAGITGPQLTAGYLQFFEPDVYAEAKPGLAKAAGLSDLDMGVRRPRVVSLDDFVRTQDQLRFGTDIFDFYNALYQKEYKFVFRQDQGICAFRPGGKADTFIEAVFGVFPKSRLEYVSSAFEHIFEPTLLKPTAENCLKVIDKGRYFPLAFTRHDIQALSENWQENPRVFILDPANPFDLIDLWNLRLFQSAVLPVNVDWIGETCSLLRKFIRNNFWPWTARPQGPMNATVVEFARSLSPGIRHIVGEQLKGLPKDSWYAKDSYDPIWRAERSLYPLNVSADNKELSMDYSRAEPDVYVEFQALSPAFARDFAASEARWVNVLNIHDYGEPSGLATFWLSSAQDPHRSSTGFGGPVLFSRAGLVLPQRHKGHRVLLNISSGKKAIIKFFKRCGFEVGDSDPGRIADQILSAVDGFSGSGILAHKETLELLDKMAKSVRVRSRQPNHRQSAGETWLEEYPDRTSPVEEWASLLAKRSNEQSPSPTMDEFVKAGALKLGLCVNCPNCRKRNWYGLREIDSHIQCSRCLKRFPFPQGALDFRRTPWHYRVAGPFSVPDFAGGAYATILSLRTFARCLGGPEASLVFSTNLDIMIDETVVETDFTFLFRRQRVFGRWEEPLIVAGEAKSFAQDAIKERDIERLKLLAGKIPGIFLVIAILKERLSPQEAKRVTRLARWGRSLCRDGRPRAQVIILTATELFVQDNIADAWRRKGGEHARLCEAGRLDNLGTLAKRTQRLYLLESAAGKK